MAQLVLGLAARHRVALLYLRAPDEPLIDPHIVTACVIVQEVKRPPLGHSTFQRWRRRLHLIAGWWRGRPMQATDWAVAAFHEQLGQLVATWQPDIIQIENHIMGQYVSVMPPAAIPLVLTDHEPGLHAAKERVLPASGLNKLVLKLDQWAWQRFEPAILRRVQAVIVFTERDQQVLAPVAGATSVHCIPFGTAVAERPLNPHGGAVATLLFVGSFIHAPNVDAAVRLSEAILPLVLAQVPDVRLLIVGDQPPPHLTQLADDNVTVTGFVPDVTPYLDQATVVVVPLRLGGGMRVKVLEALAAGKAVVASPIAVAGLDLTPGQQFMLAETDAEFAAALVALLDNREQRVALANQARRWAEQHLGWATTIDGYERVYDNLVARAV